MKLVRVLWVDAVSDESGWKHIDTVRGQRPPLVKSVGWLIAKTKSHVTPAASIVGNDCDGDVTIPVGMIRSIVELTVKK